MSLLRIGTLMGSSTATGEGGASPGAFSPVDLSPLAWWDPSDLSTLWQDTAGTVPVTADGQSVARMDDKSGNGHPWTQATTAKQGVYKESGGLRYILFDGVDDTYASSIAVTPPASHYLVGLVTGTGTARFIDGTTASGGIFRHSFGRAAGGTLVAFAGSTIGSPGALDESAHVIGAILNGATSNLRLDGVEVASGNAGANVGQSLSLMYSQPNSKYSAGHFYGYVIIDGSVPSANLEAWLGAKAGLSI